MNYTFAGIDHIQLAAPIHCEQLAREFYSECLGMAEVVKPQALRHRGGVWFQCGSQQLHIGVQEAFVPARKAHPGIEVSPIAALRERLIRHGYTVQDDANREGIERFYVHDPFGNRLEFMEKAGPID